MGVVPGNVVFVADSSVMAWLHAGVQGRPGGNAGCTGDADLNWDNNLHIYRFAETLLNAAELGMNINPSEAQGYFDRVRQRAGLEPLPLNIDNIIDERRREFVGEGKRYFDLVRTNKAAQVLKAGGGVLLDKETMTWGGTAIPQRSAWTENKKFLPIPQSEIEASQGVIVQNPY